jgi:hypothetical protein
MARLGPVCRLGLFLSFGPGCATLVSGKTQGVTIHTDPHDAKIVVDDQESYNGGSTVQLSRDKVHTIEVSKEGFAPKRLILETSINPWLLGNLIFLPLFWVGFLVDAMSGSASSVDATETLTVALSPGSGAPGAPAKDRAIAASASRTLTDPPGQGALANGAQRAWVVAVMDVACKSPELSHETVSALGDQLRVFLAQRGLRVVDRGAQEAALRSLVQEAKQKSYATCVDDACQIPLGKALAASHILRSGLVRFGSTCAANGELIDLRTEVTVAAASARSDCTPERLLDAAERLSDELIRTASH